MGGIASIEVGLSMSTATTSPAPAEPTAFRVMSCGLGHESPIQSTVAVTATDEPSLSATDTLPLSCPAAESFFFPNNPIVNPLSLT